MPPQGADRQGRNVSFQPREFVPSYQNTSGRHCFRCGSTDHIATRCLPGTMELSTQEQQRLRQEWLTRTDRTAASVAHMAISEEESDLESVEADSHIPGRDTRRTPGARMAQPADGTYDSESDGQGPEEAAWHWAFELGVAAARAGKARRSEDKHMDSGSDTEPLPQTERMTGYVPQGKPWPPESPTRMDDSRTERPTAPCRTDSRSGTASSPTLPKN